MSDTSNLYRVVIAVLKNVNLTYRVMQDGQVALDELPELFQMGRYVYEIATHVGEAADEFEALSQTELENLQVFVQDELDLPNDGVELIVEAAINTALMFYSFFGKKTKA